MGTIVIPPRNGEARRAFQFPAQAAKAGRPPIFPGPAVQRILQSVFWLAIAATLFFALRKVTVFVPTSDKTQHAVTFAFLTALAAAAYPRARLWAVAFALSGFGALVEFLQPYFHRDRDYRDWIADTIGILIVFAMVLIVRKLLVRGRNSAV